MQTSPGDGDVVGRPAGSRRLGVVVVDSLGVVRAGLCLLISGHPGMEVLGQAGDADEAESVIGRLRRRTNVIVLVGLHLPGRRDAGWLIHRVRERFPTVKVLACGSQRNRVAVARALWAGADGFADMQLDELEFLEAVSEVATGEMVLAGLPTEALGEIADHVDLQGETALILSGREREVLVIAAEGLSAREIGERLGVSERTVQTHLGHTYRKLGVKTRVEAIAIAAASGIVPVVHTP